MVDEQRGSAGFWGHGWSLLRWGQLAARRPPGAEDECTCVELEHKHSGHTVGCPMYVNVDNVSRGLPEERTFINGVEVEQTQTFCITTDDECFSPEKVVEINGFRFVSLRLIDHTFEHAAPELDGDNETRREFWRKWFRETFGGPGG